MSALGVFLIVGIVVYAMLLWLAGSNAREGSAGGRAAALTLVALPALAAVPWTLLSWYGSAAKCETCATGWQSDPQAWQWTAELVFAVIGLAMATSAAALAARRHYRVSTVLVTGAFTAVVAEIVIVF